MFIFRSFSKYTQCYRSTAVYWFVVSIIPLTLLHLIPNMHYCPNIWCGTNSRGQEGMSMKKLKFRQCLPPVILSYLVPARGVEGNYIVFKPFWPYLRLTPLKNKFRERKLYVNGLHHKLHSVDYKGVFAMSTFSGLNRKNILSFHIWETSIYIGSVIVSDDCPFHVLSKGCFNGGSALLFSLYPR